MNNLFFPARTPSEQRLRQRIFNVLPAASFQFDRLLQLLDIVESDLSPTACVECSAQPRLHLNPGFVAEYCQRDEHLFLLIMHELYHVILGHTRLFARPTPVHNLAFDAVINSLLSHQFPDPGYLSFFQGLNSWEAFPSRLLRPPPGWPDRPEPLPGDASQAERKAIELLYGDSHNSATYYDVFEALLKTLPPAKADRAVGGCILLGDHSGKGKGGDLDEKAVEDVLLKQVFRRIVEVWPPPPTPIAGRDEGHGPEDFWLPGNQDPHAAFARALRRLLRRAGILKPSSRLTRRSPGIQSCLREFQTVLPLLGDRRAPAFERLWGRRPIFFRGERLQPKRVALPRDVAHVYLDISGSMTECLPVLGAALWKPHRDGEVRLFAFSTVVDEAHPRQPLDQQKFKNTYGTDINCVLSHLADLSRKATPRRVVVLTDGYTGQPRLDLAGQLAERGVSLFVGLVGTNTSSELQPFARRTEQLPDF
jgi:hypothetical protein